ncbi:MAG: serine hydrolase [Pseudomonadota bacterium]
MSDALNEIAAEHAGIDAYVLIEGGVVVAQGGEVSLPLNTASVRKSVLSVLVGAAVHSDALDLGTPLDALKIDDPRFPLSATERSATLQDLLMSRSGIYLPAGGDTPQASALRPKRGSDAPGTVWAYSNWGFNALGVAVERAYGKPLGQTFDRLLAQPLGLHDFAPDHLFFETGEGLPTYRLFLSTRDLARIGALMLADGVWEGTRILPTGWATESFTPWSEVGPPWSQAPVNGYGYSWWINTQTGAAVASGWGGQYLYVDPATQSVLALRSDTGTSPLRHFVFRQFGARGDVRGLLRLLSAAAIPSGVDPFTP